MTHICLLLSGAALLINGLALLGTLPRRDAAVFSLLIGSIQLVLAVVHVSASGVSAGGGTPSLLGASGMFLFGLTYTYVGLDVLLALGSKGLGCFCGMVAGCGLLLAASWSGQDLLLAVLWLCWAYLWLLFFLHLALGVERLRPLIGWSLVLTSQASATAPAVLGITGQWPGDPTGATAAAALLALLLLALLLLAGGLARRGRRIAARAATGNSPLPGQLRL
ncbi:AmiS/UreI family transporter [Arthrobacter sp. NPDC093139]|uniref:AmiS/UreI family transporter n=1 Tax=Arthrobacter sp. NPDC093139 TaxID=3363945 RepID=UPI00380B587B